MLLESIIHSNKARYLGRGEPFALARRVTVRVEVVGLAGEGAAHQPYSIVGVTVRGAVPGVRLACFDALG